MQVAPQDASDLDAMYASKEQWQEKFNTHLDGATFEVVASLLQRNMSRMSLVSPLDMS